MLQLKSGVQFGDLRTASKLFADEVVSLASLDRDLKHTVRGFAAECEAAGMRVSTSKSETVVLHWKTMDSCFWAESVLLPQVETVNAGFVPDCHGEDWS